MSAERQIADILKNGRETLRVGLAEFKGSRYADLRIYATNSDGALVPTKAGVAIRPSMIRQTIDALIEAERIMRAEGLLKDRGEA